MAYRSPTHSLKGISARNLSLLSHHLTGMNVVLIFEPLRVVPTSRPLDRHLLNMPVHGFLSLKLCEDVSNFVLLSSEHVK